MTKGITSPHRHVVLWALVAAQAGALRAEIPFATRVIEYAPAPGQFISDPTFNDPIRSLGPPLGGGTSAPNNESVVTLGGFGGVLVLGFDHTVEDHPLNPLGLDAIVFGNAYWVGGNPDRHWAECATIEISRDDNSNGLADDTWYLIPGSHLATPVLLDSVTWAGGVTTYAYELPDMPFGATVVVNPVADTQNEGIYGYAEYSPTLFLGDLDGDDLVDDDEMSPEMFYTVPDNPFEAGLTPGSGGGDAFDIAWALDPETGKPANLVGFDFVRLTTPLHIILPAIGEKSAEIDAVADVEADTTGDADTDGDLDLVDASALQHCFGKDRQSTECELVGLSQVGSIDGTDAAHFLGRMTGP